MQNNIICQFGDRKKKYRHENLTGEHQNSFLFQFRKLGKREVNSWGEERDCVMVLAHASRFPTLARKT